MQSVRAADDQNRIVEHLQRALHLGRKIHMTWCIKQYKADIIYSKNRLLGEDRDAALSLERIGIQKSVPVVHAAEAAQRARGV